MYNVRLNHADVVKITIYARIHPRDVVEIFNIRGSTSLRCS